MYTLFLTGGIGAGKSTAVAHLAARGARVIDLDQVAHEVLDEPAVKLALVERFGEDVLPGVAWNDDRRLPVIFSSLYLDEGRACDYDDLADFDIDRAVLASRAFADEGSTRALDAITHPRIMERLGEMLQVGGSCVPSVGEEAPLCVVEVPLIDAAGRGLADEVMTLACPVEERRRRAVARGMDADDFDRRDARQVDDAERARIADTVIDASGTPEQVMAALDAWWEERHALGQLPAPRATKAPAAGARAPRDVPATTLAPDAPCDVQVPGVSHGAPGSPAIAFVGRHNSGKTTLVTRVISELVARGYDVGSVKHHGHRGFEIDVPGKDSWRHRQAGASEVAVCSPDRFALMRELDEELECAEVVGMMRPHDVVVVEGYRYSGLPTIEVMRSGNERDAVAAREFVRAASQVSREGGPLRYDPSALGRDADRMPGTHTVGVVSDIAEVRAAAAAIGMVSFGLDGDVEAIADFIVGDVMDMARHA